MRRKLSGSGFQVVFDINGREAVEAEPILDALAGRGGSLEQYIYCSSAGVWGGGGRGEAMLSCLLSSSVQVAAGLAWHKHGTAAESS